MSFNFMAEVTVHGDFGAQENEMSPFFPSICHEVMAADAIILVFLMLSFKPLVYAVFGTEASSTLRYFFLNCNSP